MTINSHYVSTRALEEYFVDKVTGEPLANGQIFFYKDDDRNTAKAVYKLSGAPPNYVFEALPNPLTLSAVGTLDDGNGNNIALYYLPYTSDEDGATEELYYVVVQDEDGVEQFTREGWPDLGSGGDPGEVASGTMVNEISNSQFVDIAFNESLSLAYTGSATETIQIGPAWDLLVEHTDAGTVTVARNAIAGSTNVPTNPPYTLTITAGANLTALKLRQRYSGNPDIWVPSSTGVRGYINTGILLGANTSAVVDYVPSSGTSQEILNETNSTAATAYFGNTVQLTPGDNSQAGGTGYVDIIITLNNASGFASTISSVQIIGLESSQSDVPYRQDSIARQEDYLAHYYKPLLSFKPIPSFLIGWDFDMNPAQALSSTVAASSTAPGFSKYVWDQTILFQSVDNNVGITRAAGGGIAATLTASGQFAYIQYLDQTDARRLLSHKLSSHIRGLTDNSSDVPFTVSLWYTTGATLPVLTAGTANSLVQTLDSNGKPATFNQAGGVDWTEVPRNGLNASASTTSLIGDATGSLGTSLTDFGFSGWDPQAGTDTSATFFAIVVGTGSIGAGNVVRFDWISLVPGDIPTPPGVESRSTVQYDCGRYYQKSFLLSTVPAQNVGATTGEEEFPAVTATTGVQTSPFVKFGPRMRATPTITLYNPAAANAQVRNLVRSEDCSASVASGATERGFYLGATGSASTAVSDNLAVHWTADARLGLV